MKLILLLITGLLFVGCASGTKKAVEPKIEKSKEFTKAYDETWNGVIKFFATKNIPIKTLDKNSGLIVTDDFSFTTDSENDAVLCDKVSFLGAIQRYTGKASFNVLLEKVNTKIMRVSLNMKAGYLYTGINGLQVIWSHLVFLVFQGELSKRLYFQS